MLEPWMTWQRRVDQPTVHKLLHKSDKISTGLTNHSVATKLKFDKRVTGENFDD
jgi:hypothetical protein